MTISVSSPAHRRSRYFSAKLRLRARGKWSANQLYKRRTLFLALFGIGALSYLAVVEADQSYIQSLLVSRADKAMSFKVAAGASRAILFPRSGPYDRRLGYVGLASTIARLGEHHFTIERQAVPSSALVAFIHRGGYPLYKEKLQAGLRLIGRSGSTLSSSRYPAPAYESFDEIPPILVNTLRFIEDRDLLDARYPYRNPAVAWRRLIEASIRRTIGVVFGGRTGGGASTLATQIEKFRHSAGGRTDNPLDKLRQMVSATFRAYFDGPYTIDAQRRIVTTYLDSTPLGSRPGYGEVIGLGEGLRVWYGADFGATNRLLSDATPGSESARRAQLYKEALSLLIAQRRPSYYLNDGRTDLERLTDAYLSSLAAAGIIDPELRDAASKIPLSFARVAPAPRKGPYIQRKAVNALRIELARTIGVNLYSLDRMDLSASTSIDATAQERIAALLARLKDPNTIESLGLYGNQLLGGAAPGKVAWSIDLYERGKSKNLVRLRADSLNQPFDINSGSKLILGSTAKLRTLATYLGIIDNLYRELSGAPSRSLKQLAETSDDPLRRWEAEYLSAIAPDKRNLQQTLDAAMKRRYSADPAERFFTGGGVQVFHNFDHREDSERPTVEEAFERSINLAFIRLLRDVIKHYEAGCGACAELFEPGNSPLRVRYLKRFADEEGTVYISEFFHEYKGLSPKESLNRLASRITHVPKKFAVVFRSVHPNASVADMRAFLSEHSAGWAPLADKLYSAYAPGRIGLNDRAYLAGINPLELWFVGYLQKHPHPSRSQVIAASASVRQEAYSWLFKTTSPNKQNIRIRTIVEEDAFSELLRDWRRQGYPFNDIVPSLATAIGSSGDRPDALSNLMGVILSDGVKLPTVDIERITFAAKTPFETQLAYKPAPPRRVMAPEVAATLRRALSGVVENGTAERLRNVFTGDDGAPLSIGGKTGTGDNRFKIYAPGMRLIESRVVDRTATFVFYIGDRIYGTITAYVQGPAAAQYHFTSALAVSLLRSLAPDINPLMKAAAGSPRQQQGL